jgi:hypothetical protein
VHAPVEDTGVPLGFKVLVVLMFLGLAGLGTVIGITVGQFGPLLINR